MKTLNMKTFIISVVCLMLVSTAMMQIESVAAAKDTKILFKENFENHRNLKNVFDFVTTPGDNIPGVVAPGGSWKVIDDGTGNQVLEAKSVEARGTAAFAGDMRWKDYTIEARTITTDSYMGLIVQADSTGKNYYDCYISPNWPGGLIEIYKHTDGIWGRSLLNEVYSNDYFTQDQWIDFKVVVTHPDGGTLLQVFFKIAGPNTQYPETPQASYLDTDNPYTSGRIGLLYYDNGAWGNTYELFDNVIVTAPK
jgi:hypothetical protein